MAELKTEKEKILELKTKIHEMRTRKLLTIDYLETETKKLIDSLSEMDKKLQEIQGKIEEEKMPLKLAYAVIKSIEARKSILDGWKMALKECRLALTYLVKEEGKLEYELMKIGG
jgi:vacuolar-type H+-ATPase subunit I/STV1